jgi:uncharacterized OB-fold protein
VEIIVYEKPLPIIDPESRPYWSALSEHRLMLKYCTSCHKFHFYPRELCPYCHSDVLEWRQSTGDGTIYSFTIARRPAGTAFAAEVPYVIGVIELDDGPRMTATVVTGDVEAVEIGQRVSIMFDDVTEEITLARFVIKQQESAHEL